MDGQIESQANAGSNAIKIASEYIVGPGTSQVLSGNISSGLIHYGAGLLAKSLLGPLGVLLVCANSYSNATTHRHLHQHFTK
jgi:hypothetical protein